MNMNRTWYKWVIQKRFAQWLDGHDGPLVVQDFERCLRCSEPLAAFAAEGMELVEKHPKMSPDLHAIENAWSLLRQRLAQTLPVERETRDDFCVRLRRAVRWLNDHKDESLKAMCLDMKDRARDVLKLKGARTKW